MMKNGFYSCSDPTVQGQQNPVEDKGVTVREPSPPKQGQPQPQRPHSLHTMAPKSGSRRDDQEEDELAPPHKQVRRGGDNGVDPSRKAKFKAHLTALNSQFAHWIASQKSAHASELWTPGVRDYIKHAEQLLKDFQDVVDAEKQGAVFGAAATQAFSHVNGPFGASSAPATASTATLGFNMNGSWASKPQESAAGTDTSSEPPKAAWGTGTSSFGTTAPATTTTTTTAPASGGFFNFGGASAASTSSTGAGSSAATTTSSMFSFGQGSSSLPAPSFGNAAGFGGFKFGGGDSAAPPPFALAAAGGSSGGAGEEEEAEEPQKFESTVEANEEAGQVHYKSKAKFMHLKGKEWDTKGVGLLCVRTPKDDPTKPFITFTTEAGRVLYCANVHKTMKTIVNEAKNAVTWGAVWSPDGSAAPSLQSVMALLPKGKSPELRDAIEQAQAKMP